MWRGILTFAIIILAFLPTQAQQQLENIREVRIPVRIDRHFWFDGTPRAVEIFINEQRDSIYQSWHSNGQPHIEARYRTGRLDGPYKKWGADGSLLAEGNYTNGRKTGTWTYYNKSGQPRTREH